MPADADITGCSRHSAMAHRQLAGRRSSDTLFTTALVHEAFLSQTIRGIEILVEE
jgi:hypothetical protein